MDDRIYNIRISPEVIRGDIFLVNYTGDSYNDEFPVEICCDIITSAVTKHYTGQTYVYSSMTEILSGDTNGTSLLTGLTIPILLTETCVDIGYYSVFDGAVLQSEVVNNFLFSSTTTDPYKFYFYNTSDTKNLGYLLESVYKVDWGDGTPIQTVTNFAPNSNSHTYPQSGTYTITLKGYNPWGVNIIKKDVNVPFTNTTISNPKGHISFIPAGGNWSATPISYDYIFSGDSNCDIDVYNFSGSPNIISGYTTSNVGGLQVYGPSSGLYDGKYKIGYEVTGTSGNVGIFYGPDASNTYISYTINGIDYYDYYNGTTVFIVKSSGITSQNLICSAITKNEVLLNVIDEPQIETNVYIDRGKISAYERILRLDEVNSIGEMVNYGYKFFNFVKY